MTFIEEYRAALRVKILEAKLDCCTAASIDDLRRRQGIITGLDRADGLIAEMLNKIKEREDEE